MSTFLCAVPKDLSENYEIGLSALTWGVERKHEKRIRAAKPGDKLVFVVAGTIRSVHTITSAPFVDESPLWPSRRNDVYPVRIRIGEAEAQGRLLVRDIADAISFMKGKSWGGTIQGANGVFNEKLTPEDLDSIMRALTKPGCAQQVKQAEESELKYEVGNSLGNRLPTMRLAGLKGSTAN